MKSKNLFYNDFDKERVEPSSRVDDFRTPFQIDRDRVIHSSEFRRLQGKTQVFLSGEYDYYRTRLTHSIEVAQVGRSICAYLNTSDNTPFTEEYFIDEDLVEAASLAHDLGHPPFGHAGERILNELMKNYGGFEGNAQTLRLITDIFYRIGDHRRGMKPTRAFLDSILKYKIPYSELENPENHFIYDEQARFIDFVFGGIEPSPHLYADEKLNDFRSIECQIMDWADDTSYAINDIADSIAGKFMTIKNIERWAQNNSEELGLGLLELTAIEKIITWIRDGVFKSKLGSEIGDFIHAISIKERKTFMDNNTNRYKYELVIDRDILKLAKLYKRVSVDIVFRSPQIFQMEFKGNHILRSIFNALSDNYINEVKAPRLLPEFTDSLLRAKKYPAERARVICDYIAGMTDNYAGRTFKRLYDPDFISFSDFI
jgi:dGTPase